MNENAETQTKASAEPRLLTSFREQVIPELKERMGIDNSLAVPCLEKIVLNMGVGLAKENDKILTEAQLALSTISGQKPVVTRARKSVAGFKIRTGLPIGCKVTLRRYRMYEFMDRLINIVFPRIRDFRGFPVRSFDGKGNYTLGLDEFVVFPEIDPDSFDNSFGLDVTICTTADNDEDARQLFDQFGFPFKK